MKNMTIRDVFAAHAMQGIMSNPHTITPTGTDYDEFYARVAQHAFMLADAMMKERAK